MLKSILLTILGLLLLSLPLKAQQKNISIDKGHPFNQFTINTLIQSEGRFSLKDDSFQGGRSFRAANARISIKDNLDGGYFYRIFFNVAPQPALLDAFVGYKHSDAFSFSFGAMKPKQTLDFIPDPGSHNFVDRATITGLLVGSREMGFSASGTVSDFYYYTGFFNGTGLNNNNNNNFYGIGRLQYTLRDIFPGTLQLAVSGSHGISDSTITGSKGPLLRGKRTILGSDLELKTGSLYLAAEYLQGQLETADLTITDETISGYYLTGGYSINKMTTAFLRWQSYSYKKADTSTNKLTFGTNFSLTDIVGLVLNLDAFYPDQGSEQYGLSFILQVQF